MDTQITRRQFASAASRALALVALGGCSLRAAQNGDGRLAARPRGKVRTTIDSGPLGPGSGARDGVIQLPSTMPNGKVPLLVYLHGASGSGERPLRRIGSAANQSGVAALAPDSRNGTRDAIRGSFGDDVAFLNRAFVARCNRRTTECYRLSSRSSSSF